MTAADGMPVEVVELSNGRGGVARIASFGATLQCLTAPDRDGHYDDVVLGYDDVTDYVTRPAYLGSTIGRYANRIGGGRFTLDGRDHDLVRNDGPHTLHGGDGFDRRPWQVVEVTSQPLPSVLLALHSPDGDQGFPGALDALVRYTLTGDDELRIEFSATANAATIVNLTNHSYFNLSGVAIARSALDHRLSIVATHFTPVDETLIPTGDIREVGGTSFDFTRPTRIAARLPGARDRQLLHARGYDHNFVVSGAASTLRQAARLADPVSGRTLDVLTTAPGLQLYTGNAFDGTIVGKGGRRYHRGDGVALEPQLFPDTPRKPSFGRARIGLGEIYRHDMRFRFSVSS